MREGSSLGEFEQLVLLAVLQLDGDAYAPGIRIAIEDAGSRRVTRGALYSTLDRLETKRYLQWRPDPNPPSRAGAPRRKFEVTPTGLAALRRSLAAVTALTQGLERKLGAAR